MDVEGVKRLPDALRLLLFFFSLLILIPARQSKALSDIHLLGRMAGAYGIQE